MSDYLNTLLARTRNLSPVVQPRLASLFEPSAITNGNFSRPAFEDEAGREARAERDTSPQRSPVSASQTRQPAHRDSSAATVVPAAPAERKQTGDGERHESREDLSGHAQRPLSTVIPAPSSLPPQPARTAAGVPPEAIETMRSVRPSPQLHAPRGSEEKAATPSTVEALGRGNWAELEPKVRRIVREHLSPLQPSQTRAADGGETVSPRPRPAAGTPAAAQAQTNRPHTTAQTFAPGIVEPLPTISVTIGRVEVRAIIAAAAPPPALAPRSAQPTETLSLGDYLKQRSGERR